MNPATKFLLRLPRQSSVSVISRSVYHYIRYSDLSMVKNISKDENLTVGPWPRTKEERERAAKKYNLIPEDYEPYEEGDAFGDYPKLKAIGAFNRDPYDDYDDPVDMRFYGEVFHLDSDLYHWERIDPLAHEKQDIPLWIKAIVFFCLGASMPTLHYIFDRYRLNINQPFKQRWNFRDQKFYDFPSSSSSGNHNHH